jgi:hypothetical protein
MVMTIEQLEHELEEAQYLEGQGGGVRRHQRAAELLDAYVGELGLHIARVDVLNEKEYQTNPKLGAKFKVIVATTKGRQYGDALVVDGFEWSMGVGLANRKSGQSKHGVQATIATWPSLYNPKVKHTYTINLAEVMARVCEEYETAGSMQFEEWASNFGFDTDSRKAEAMYQACLSHGPNLRKLGLTEEQRQALAMLASEL